LSPSHESCSMAFFFITTLGCKVNQQESDAISACLEAAGWQKTAKIRDAAVLILNTCTVTGKAALQSRQQIRNLVRHNPQALLMVTGCCAQTEGKEIAAMEGVDHVVSHTDKHRIPELLEHLKTGNPLPYPACHGEKACEETRFQDIPAPARDMGRTRAFLKIQDGCNAFCTYCIVPLARGRSRSLNPDTLREKVKSLTQAGYREVVLTGIHVGMYGADLEPGLDLTQLLRLLLADPDCPRLRLGSLEPVEVSDSLIHLAASDARIAPHFHIPLQSASDAILRAMGRPYDFGFYADRILTLRKALPKAAIGADILVGFPGETDGEFEKAEARIKALPLTYFHVFPYSPRPGTPAADYPDPVPQDIAKKRSSRLREMGEKKQLAFARSLTGETLEVIFERHRDKKTGKLKGLTDNYQTLLAQGPDTLLSQKVRVRVTAAHDDARLEGDPWI